MVFPHFMTRNASPANPASRITSGVPLPGAEVMRALTIGKIDAEARTVELSFSSDAEILRWPGFVEVLDHSPGAVDLSRLNSAGPLLFNHNLDDVIGVIEDASIVARGKGRALVRFGKSARANEMWDNVRDGILRNVSVGYRINEIKLKESRDDGNDVYLVTRWEPYEISIVSAPADTSVGIGRSHANTNQPPKTTQTRMNKEQLIALLAKRGITPPAEADIAELTRLVIESEPSAAPATPPAPSPGAPALRSPMQVLADNSAAAMTERARIKSLRELGKTAKIEDSVVQRAIDEGTTLDGFRATVLETITQRDKSIRRAGEEIGLTDKEKDSFRFTRLFRYLIDTTDKAAERAAGFEIAVVSAAAEKRENARGYIIPMDVLTRPLDMDLRRQIEGGRRDIVSIKTGSGYTGDGGNTVATTLLASSFIELLRNKTVMMRAGTVLGGLVGNFDIPKQIGGAAAAWLGEDDSAANTDVNFGLIHLSPKTLACYSEVTRKMLHQSSMDIEALMRRDLAKGMGQAIDYAAIYGDGTSNTPIGILETSGIGSVDFAGANPTYGEIVDLETEVAADNIEAESAMYLFNARMRGHLKKTPRFGSGTETVIWEGSGFTGGVNGYPAAVTNQIANGDVIFGDMSEFLIGMWGGLDVMIDPFSNSLKGRIRIVNFQDIDFEARRPEAFAYGVQIP